MPRLSTHDMTSAYKQVAVAPEQLCFSVIAIFSPIARTWVSWTVCHSGSRLQWLNSIGSLHS